MKVDLNIKKSEYKEFEYLCQLLKITPERLLSNHITNLIRHYSDKDESFNPIPAFLKTEKGKVKCSVLNKTTQNGKPCYRILINGDTILVDEKSISFTK